MAVSKTPPLQPALTELINQSIKDKVSQILPVRDTWWWMNVKGKHCLTPPQREQTHEEERRYEFVRLVLTAKDVNDSPRVERDEHLT